MAKFKRQYLRPDKSEWNYVYNNLEIFYDDSGYKDTYSVYLRMLKKKLVPLFTISVSIGGSDEEYDQRVFDEVAKTLKQYTQFWNQIKL